MRTQLMISIFLLIVMTCVLWAQETATSLQYPNIRIMIVVPETHISRRLVDPAGETELIRMFTRAKYRVVDQSQYAAIRYSPEMEEVVNNPTGLKARALTTKYGADILIVGEAVSEMTGTTRNGVACRARIEVRAVVTRGDARIITATDGVDGSTDASEMVAAKSALRKAGNRAGQYLLREIGDSVKGPTQLEGEESFDARPVIAVAPFDDRSQWSMANWNLGQQLPDLISAELLKRGNVRMVDLANRDTTIDIQTDYISGLYDNVGAASELGTLLKADYLVVGRITEFSTKRTGIDLGILAVAREKP